MALPSTLLIFGAGGHGRVVADAALVAGHWSAITASDRNPALCVGNLLDGIVLVFPESVMQPTQKVHIAIGANLAREREADWWGSARLVSVFHPTAAVSKYSRVAPGCFVAAGAVVAPGASVEVGVIINHGAVVDHDVTVGAFCHVAPKAALGGNVVLGRRVFVGAGAVVLPGKQIGSDITIGAGSLVRTDLTEPGVYAGVPAKRIR